MKMKQQKTVVFKVECSIRNVIRYFASKILLLLNAKTLSYPIFDISLRRNLCYNGSTQYSHTIHINGEKCAFSCVWTMLAFEEFWKMAWQSRVFKNRKSIVKPTTIATNKSSSSMWACNNNNSTLWNF